MRERKEDIPLLAHHFLSIHSAKLGKNVEVIPDREMQTLMQYDWPGNVREIQNVIERGVILSTGPIFRVPELGPTALSESGPEGLANLAEVERRHIIHVLEKTGWKVSGAGGAAEILDLHPSTLSFRMKKLGVNRPERKNRKNREGLD